ncbi:phage portal protein [Biomaibacter acetigenes]|uniref:Phage portal protein n=1 Tax=Biomaibacter acetigenes TaxID=2316383 RepID=A0A3G2R575_9FIRM|nr:phage portal protein [Biomaibacter acetigenes]AYO30606.1 phage portal protein [Biomaibacter acetigenes]
MAENQEQALQATIYKAQVLGGKEIVTSNKIEEDPFVGLYGQGIAIEPPYDLRILSMLPEYSNILGQCIDAMETNIDGFGFTLVPAEGVAAGEDGKYPPEAEAERRQILNFFRYCNPDESFVKIRRKTRRDLETTGNAYWEILRNGRGEIAGIEHLESYTMRLTPLDKEATDINIKIKTDSNTYEEIPHRKRFRRFVQIRDGITVYFKEFGDPRPIDAKTGKVLTEEEAKKTDITLATEVIHFKIYSPRTPYGIPRWIGNILAVQGSRQAEEVNYEYFDNKTVPPLAVLVSGRLAADSVTRIEDYIQNNIKGRKGFHKILVIEAETTPNPLAPSGQKAGIEIKPLTEAQQKDALFVDYDEKNQEKVRSAFRLPPIYVGRTKDFNRSTAEESKRVAEEQVFGPERDDFDFTINRLLFPAMDVKYWEFKSLAPTADNAKDMTEMLGTFIKAGMTVKESRRIMEEILNKELPDPEGADWLKEPLEVYLAKLKAGSIDTNPGDEAQALKKFASFLIDVRKRLEEYEYSTAE